MSNVKVVPGSQATRPLVVFCAGRPWYGVAGTNRHLAGQLTRHADLLWVDPPVSPTTPSRLRYGASRASLPRMRVLGEGVTGLFPVVPPMHTRPGVWSTSRRLVRGQIRWALRRLRRRPAAVIDGRMARLLGGWGEGVRNVLYGTDDFVAGARLMNVAVDRVVADERHAIAHADLVLAVSSPLQERWRSMGAEVLLVPNGVCADAYADLDVIPPASNVDLPRPIAGVVGQLSARIDMRLLEAVVAAGCSLLLVGPVDEQWEPERFAALRAQPRVRWVGFQPHERLAGYLRHIDVGLTPYAPTEFNRASFPLKTLEYLAAGRPTVSTDLPATRWLDTDLVHIGSDAEDFARAVVRLAAEDGPELARARRAFAEGHSWRARAATIADALGLPGDGGAMGLSRDGGAAVAARVPGVAR